MAKKKAAPDRDALENLVSEMNEVLALDPPLKVGRKSTDEDLIEMICDEENSGEIFEVDFKKTKGKKTFTAEARETLEALGVEIQKDPAKGKKVVEEEPEEELEEEEEKPKAKKGAKKEVQEELPLEDEKPVKKGKKVVEEEPEEETPKAKKGAKAAPAKAEKPKVKKEKSEKYTRYMSVAEVLSSGKSLTETEIAEKANDLYVKHGGNEGVAQSERIVDRALQLVRALGIVEEKAGKIKYTV